jgi:AcrR family transcriptional regulator
MTQPATGHRERKKQQTRDAIARAALELFAERGYDATTLAEIAERAGVATRTIFAYFPSKEDILFSDFETVRGELAQALAERPDGKDALGTLRDFILSVSFEKGELDRQLHEMIERDETLRTHRRARMAQLQELLAGAMADDLGAASDDLRPQLAAASLTAAFEVLEQQDPGSPQPHTPEALAAAIDPIIAFVRAGLAALPAPPVR